MRRGRNPCLWIWWNSNQSRKFSLLRKSLYANDIVVITGVEELCNHTAHEKAYWAESSACQSEGMKETQQ